MDDGSGGSIKKEKTPAEIRKSNKPLMEKRRRERINNCLDQLKSLLMEVTKKESSYYSKLEKADILEMTVKYLKNMKRQQLTVAVANDPSVVSKYIAGFNECTNEVTKYLRSVDGLTSDMKTRLMGHLADCLQRQFSNKLSSGGPNLPTGSQPSLGLQIPAATQLTALPGSSGVCVLSPTNPHPSMQAISASPMQLVPAKLPNGELVFLLTNSSQVHGTNNLPIVSAVTAPTSSNQANNNFTPSQDHGSACTSTVSPVSETAGRITPLSNSRDFGRMRDGSVSETIPIGNASTSKPPMTAAIPDRIRSTYFSTTAENKHHSPNPLVNQEPAHIQQNQEENRINNNDQLNVAPPADGPMWRPW